MNATASKRDREVAGEDSLRPSPGAGKVMWCSARWRGWIAALLCAALPSLAGQETATNTVRVLSVAGTVEVCRSGATQWDPAYPNQVLYSGDRLRTDRRSGARLILGDSTPIRVQELSLLAIPTERRTRLGLRLFQGLLHFFNRDKPGELEVEGPSVWAVVRGTEFTVHATEDGITKVALIEGRVHLTNSLGSLDMTSGQVAEAMSGEPPKPTAVIATGDSGQVQWFLYYPAVLDLADLQIPDPDRSALEGSLESYRQGDPVRALALLPATMKLASSEARLYEAALLLSAGQVPASTALLESLRTHPRVARLAVALRLMIAAVQSRRSEADTFAQQILEAAETALQSSNLNPHSIRPGVVSLCPLKETALTASEWMALSYWQQYQRDLDGALESARRAVAHSPSFGFGWVRLAELEFSFGRIQAASKALDTAIIHVPRHAQAAALKGFLFNANNQGADALTWFERAIALDGSLANGWLGRGLCRFRQGDVTGGREDLLVAAAAEPLRGVLRSYLGKAFDETDNVAMARHELDLARLLDPLDPTPWLYAALMKQHDSQINSAIHDLQKSQELNRNRMLYRSQLLLDQDRAVRSANLANLYRDAGMERLSLREASRSLATDYANHSAHLFLAESFLNADDLDRRYETPRIAEFLLANLLAPLGAGNLNAVVSQGEYSRLFERDGWGVVSETEYRSHGRWSEAAAAYGTWGRSSVALDGYYLNDPGYGVNTWLENKGFSVQGKQQLSALDTLYVQPVWSTTKSGDVAQYYDPAWANPGLKVEESQTPNLVAGWHRQWHPGQDTLFLFSRLENRIEVDNPQMRVPVVRYVRGEMDQIRYLTAQEGYQNDFEAYSAELQQIMTWGPTTTIAGGRYQSGSMDARALLEQVSSDLPPILPGALTASDTSVERLALYVYEQWQVVPWLQLVGGLSYDRLTFPQNFRFAPLASQQDVVDQVAPKAGLVLTPWTGTAVRAAYSRSLGGVGFEQGFRLEPTQVAGFNQAFRSVIPESLSGAHTAAGFEVGAVAWEQKLTSTTWLTLSGEWLGSDVERYIGSYQGSYIAGMQAQPLRELLDFRERSIDVGIYQLAGQCFAFGASYRLVSADLESRYPDLPDNLAEIPDARGAAPDVVRQDASTLQQLRVTGNFNHPSGLFLGAETHWTCQDNRQDLSTLQDDEFWQIDIRGGYRVWRRRVELQVALLNVTDTDYRLHPLSTCAFLPRERTLALRLTFAF